MANINELLEGHVTLEVECIDRLYLNGYLPSLATAGGLIRFLTEHLGKPIRSPVLLGQITQGWAQAVKRWASEQGIPMLHFQHGERKDGKHSVKLKPPAKSLNVVDAFEKKVGAALEPGDGGVGHLQLFRQFLLAHLKCLAQLGEFHLPPSRASPTSTPDILSPARGVPRDPYGPPGLFSHPKQAIENSS